MIKKKLLIVIGALLILNLSLVGCGKTTEANANAENSTTSSSSSSEDKTKELDKKYVESIKPYVLNISTDWGTISNLCKKGQDIYKDNNKLLAATALADIRENWKQIFDIQSEDTPNITGAKKILKNVRELQEKAINDFIEGLDNVNTEKINQASESLNQSNEIINNELAPLIKKMNTARN